MLHQIAPGQLQLHSLPLEDTNGLSWMRPTWSRASTTRFALIWMATWHILAYLMILLYLAMFDLIWETLITEYDWSSWIMIEGSLAVKLPTRWTDGKAEVGRVREEKKRSEKIREAINSEKKEDAGARKDRKVTIHSVFPMICGSRGSKSNLAKAAGAEPSGQMRRWKVARRCGAKHISKSKCYKTPSRFGAILEVEMSKKCTPLWREAHFQVKMYKTPSPEHFLEVAMSKKCTPLWREAHFQVKMYKNTFAPDHFWKLRCPKSARHCGAKHISKSNSVLNWPTSDHFLKLQTSKKCTPLCQKAHFQVKSVKQLKVLSLFLTFRCRKSAH